MIGSFVVSEYSRGQDYLGIVVDQISPLHYHVRWFGLKSNYQFTKQEVERMTKRYNLKYGETQTKT